MWAVISCIDDAWFIWFGKGTIEILSVSSGFELAPGYGKVFGIKQKIWLLQKGLGDNSIHSRQKE